MAGKAVYVNEGDRHLSYILLDDHIILMLLSGRTPERPPCLPQDLKLDSP